MKSLNKFSYMGFLIFVSFFLLSCNDSTNLESKLDIGNGNANESSLGPDLIKYSGDLQTVNIGAIASVEIGVLAIGQTGNPLSNVPVSFAVVGGLAKGTLSSSTGTTDTNGIAKVVYTAGNYIGNVSISAISGYGSQTFTITTLGITGFTLNFAAINSGNSQTAPVNTTLTNPLRVILTDSNGDPQPNVMIRFQSAGGLTGNFNGQTYADVTTDSSGIATSPSYMLASTQGVHNVRARVLSDSTVFRDFSLTGTVSPASSIDSTATTLALSTVVVEADGMNVVNLTLVIRDSFGNAIPNSTYGNSISLTPSPGWLGSGLNSSTWVYSSTGTYTNSITVGNQTGDMIFSASINAVSLISPIDTLTLAPNMTVVPNMSTLSALTNPLVADGVSTTTLIVTLRDLHGNALPQSGHTVVVTTSSGTLIGSMVYHSSTGTYRQLLRAPSSIGSATLTVSLNTIDGTSVIGVNNSVSLIGGAFSQLNSSFDIPNRTYSSYNSSQTVTVTLRDSNNNLLDLTGASVALTKEAVSGTLNGSSTLGTFTKQSPGVYTASVTAPAGCSSAPCTERLIANVTHSSIFSGVLTEVGRIKVQYHNASLIPAAAQSLLTASAASAIAGLGASTINLTVQLRTSGSVNLNVGGNGALLAVSTTLGSTPSSIVDNDNGTYSISIPSPGTSQSGTVTVTYNGTNISGSPMALTFFGAVSPAHSTILLSSSTINGVGTSTVSLLARDSNNFAIPQVNLALADLEFTQSVNGTGSYTGVITSSILSLQARYSQTYTLTNTPPITFESVTIGARIRIEGVWTTVGSQQVLSTTPPNLAGVTIDCTNVASYRGTNLYINGATLTINSMINGVIPTTGDCAGFDASADNHPFKFTSLTIGGSGIVTHLPQNSTTMDYYGIDIEITGHTNLLGGGKIDTNAKGFRTDITGGNVSAPAGCTGIHAHTTSFNCINVIYGDPLDPKTPGAGAWSGHGGAFGGGVFRLKTSTINHNGIISSNSSGGAGGSIKLVITDGPLSGAGTMTATTDGGGGRIYIKADSILLPLQNIKAHGGSLRPGSLHIDGALIGAHTLAHSLNIGLHILPHLSSNRLDLSPQTELSIASGAELIIDQPIHLKSLTVKTGGAIGHNPVLPTNFYPRVEIQADDFINIESGGRVDARHKGYMGTNGNTISYFNLNLSQAHGYTPASCAIGPSDLTTGMGMACVMNGPMLAGSHYGRGGGAPAGVIWGNPLDPSTYGGGSIGRNSWEQGLSGGGVIRISSKIVTIDGSLLASGADANIQERCTSAGGSIKVLASDAILSTIPTAKINADGGSYNYNSSSCPKSGGGGLVYVQGPGASALGSKASASKGAIYTPNPTGSFYGEDGSVLLVE